jgi:hypothetical protein
MNRIAIFASTLLATVALTACAPSINTLGGRITFEANGMTVHATGHPDAVISQDGDLSIAGKPIAATPEQRQLLQSYYQEAHAALDTGKVIGRQGAQLATRGIGAAIRSIFHGDSSQAEKRLDADSQDIEATADRLCRNVKTLAATQTAISHAIPAFAPYAAGNRMHCNVTRSTTVRNGRTKTKTTTALTANID